MTIATSGPENGPGITATPATRTGPTRAGGASLAELRRLPSPADQPAGVPDGARMRSGGATMASSRGRERRPSRRTTTAANSRASGEDSARTSLAPRPGDPPPVATTATITTTSTPTDGSRGLAGAEGQLRTGSEAAEPRRGWDAKSVPSLTQSSKADKGAHSARHQQDQLAGAAQVAPRSMEQVRLCLFPAVQKPTSNGARSAARPQRG